jgi:hypothetical protein
MKLLLSLIILFSIATCAPRPDFHYADWVYITDGFYKDHFGSIHSRGCGFMHSRDFLVIVEPNTPPVCIQSEHMRLADITDGNG